MAHVVKMGVYDDEKQKVVLSPIFDEIKDCKKGFKTKRGMYKGIYGYNGQKIIEGNFTDILLNSWAIVTVDFNNKHHIYDWCGKLILDGAFDQIVCKSQGFLVLDEESKNWKAYAYDGQPLINASGKAIFFYNKFIVVKDKKGSCYIYTYGKKEPIVDSEFISVFSVDDIIAAENEDGFGAYDATGKMVADHKWKRISQEHNGYIVVQNDSGKYSVYDFERKCIIEGEYLYIHLFDSGIGIYIEHQGYYPYDYQGNRLIDEPAQDLCIEDDVIYRQIRDEWQAFDFSGRVLSDKYCSKVVCKRHIKN